MRIQTKNTLSKELALHWNRLTAHERLKYILNHPDVFLSMKLIRPGELLAAQVAPESAREYIIEREESPFFAVLDIKKPLLAEL
jgi:hypothetical protein